MEVAAIGRGSRGGRVAVAAALVLAGAAAAAPAPTSPRSLLLISIDTLRADYLSCNGATRVRTPNLDRLAREGVNFTRARSPVPLTLPAHASLLTGNYPPTHTVRSNGIHRLPEQQLSLAEILRSRGYRTAAFVASFVLDRRFGLAQGFDLYDDRVWSAVDELETVEAERPAGEVFAAFKRWLGDAARSEPWFAWLHLYDPHAPYQPPEPFLSRYSLDPYAGEVAYCDAVVGQIVGELAQKDQLSSTIVAVVGDHGEGLGEHGEMTHSLLIYNSTLHVPMLLSAPGLVPPGRAVTSLVRIIDLAPTLLDYLGVQKELGEGSSLRPLIEGGDAVSVKEGPTAYSESLYPDLALGWSPLRGLEDGDHRLILAPTPELFDVRQDPGETTNRAAIDVAVFQRLKRRLGEAIRSFDDKGAPAEAVALEADSLEQLRSLGYVSASAGSSRSRNRPPRDPKAGLEVWNRIQLGIAQMGHDDYRSAAVTFETVLADDPDIPLVYEYLGTCRQKLSQSDLAEGVYRRALDRGIESARVHHELGRIYQQRGEHGEAERELQIALAIDPQSVTAHYDLAEAYRATRRTADAVAHYRSAVEINPAYLWAWNGLGRTLEAAGRGQEALVAFRRVVEIDPTEARGHYNLAVQLERLGLVEDAAAGYRRFLELAEDEDLATQRAVAERAVARLLGKSERPKP